MKRAAIALSALLAATGVHADSSTPLPAGAPPLEMEYVGLRGWRELRVYLTDPHRAKTYSLEHPAPPESMRQRAAQWYRGPGIYTIHAHAALPGQRPQYAEIGFRISETVTGVSARVEAAPVGPLGGKPEHHEGLLIVTVIVDRMARPDIELAALPGADERAPAGLRFVITNRSPLTLRGDFFGELSRREAGRWQSVQRGATCGTVEPRRWLAPGESTESSEGHFIGYPAPLWPGHYRYSVRVVKAGKAFIFPAEIGVGFAHDRYLLAVEFDVPARDADTLR